MSRKRLLAAVVGAAACLPIVSLAPASAAPSPQWRTVADSATQIPGTSKTFSSFNQPSVNAFGLVVFRGRGKGPQEPVRGVYTRNPLVANSTLSVVADTASTAVPSPNNTGSGFTEFPSFPRIDQLSSAVATRGQSQPVYTYALPDGTDTKVGTSGVYATTRTGLTAAATQLGAVPGFAYFAVPGQPAGTRFDQFPGAPAIDGRTVVFKGNFTVDGTSATGIYFRNLASATNAIMRIADTSTRIPNQPAGGTATFGSTAPPSAALGRTVFVGLDNEEHPTLGGIYVAPTVANPRLRTLVGIGDRVPGQPDTARFTGFGEALSFDGRYVAFEGSWGTETRSVTLTCPADGNSEIAQYCIDHYPNGYQASVPVHQGVFVIDTLFGTRRAVAVTGATFTNFIYWVFSGRPPGTGGGDEPSLEPPRWRSSAFVAVGSPVAFTPQVAFKADEVDGTTGIRLGQGNRTTTVVSTATPGTSVDPLAPAGSVVTSVGVERDGLRNHNLAVAVSMLQPDTSQTFAGVYLTRTP